MAARVPCDKDEGTRQAEVGRDSGKDSLVRWRFSKEAKFQKYVFEAETYTLSFSHQKLIFIK